MASGILPFGTSTNSPTIDIVPTKAFGCTLVDLNVSADWSSQAGSLSMRLIESDTDGDRLIIPVLGSPHSLELKDSNGNIIFQHIGLVDSFSRNSSNSKIYSTSLTSPLVILDSTYVIMDGFVGLGGSVEGVTNGGLFAGTGVYNFGHRNSSIDVSNTPGINHWWNVSNLINVYGLLENEDLNYRVPFKFDNIGNPSLYGDYGFSANSSDGIPLVKLMYALHMGINHLPQVTQQQKQRTLGGNLLFGRHNYNIIGENEGIPYYYHFDALGFYNQVSGILGPQFRVGGESKTLKEMISDVCGEANLEFYCYIDINNDSSIGEQTLQESDPNWSQPAKCSWNGLNTNKFINGGNYGGTIRVRTVNRNSFFNSNRPFSNIAYNLIGLEVPDIDSFSSSGLVHPGKRPVNDSSYGIPTNSSIYSDPLDSIGLDSTSEGFTSVGTRSITGGGTFPVAVNEFDPSQLSNVKVSNSDISIRLNDAPTMKVVTGGHQTRLVTVPKEYLKQYWGDILLPESDDPRSIADTETDSYGLNSTSTRKIPVVTQLLDPTDIDDYILIDMQEIFGDISIDGVLNNGIYACSMYEMRIAMGGMEYAVDKWIDFLNQYKYAKIMALRNYFYPSTIPANGVMNRAELLRTRNNSGGAGYINLCSKLKLHHQTSKPAKTTIKNKNANKPDVTVSTNSSIDSETADYHVQDKFLSKMHEKIKAIGDTHYGRSWYVPVPYFKTKEDLDGNNLVGNFERSWSLTDSAYVEPSNYYSLKIPQSNLFISDGKVSPFINYDHSFVFKQSGVISPSGTGLFDEAWATNLKTVINGLPSNVFNFSEYNLDKICSTKYQSGQIIHASPTEMGNAYSFLPYAYERFYDRALIPFFDLARSEKKYYSSNKSGTVGPNTAGQSGASSSENAQLNMNWGADGAPSNSNSASTYNYSENIVVSGLNPKLLPIHTSTNFLKNAVSGLMSLTYSDNGRFCFPFVKVVTERVFMPQIAQTGIFGVSDFSDIPLSTGNFGDISPVTGTVPTIKPNMLTRDKINSKMTPYKIPVHPKSISYAQVSNRHVYGPWITSLNSIVFRGKIEYEQDESLVPENFLIPINFGQFGDFELSQISGMEGLNLAAQGRANSIDDFSLFAVEEGSITIPGAPAIKRIGDGIYGIPQVTDLKINVSTDRIESVYSFKTISPRFNKTNRDIEKKISKISNKVKKLKLR